MTRFGAASRLSRLRGMAVVASAFVLAGSGLASAQSSSPTPGAEASASPVASPTVVAGTDCAIRAGLLPATIDGINLTYTMWTAEQALGGAALPPSLGGSIGDVCAIEVHYGPGIGAMIYRFPGAIPGELLGAFGTYLTDKVLAGGNTVDRSEVTVGDRTVIQLDIESGGFKTRSWIYAFADTIVFLNSEAGRDALVPVLPPPDGPVPDVTAPPATADIKFSTGRADIKHKGQDAGSAKGLHLDHGRWSGGRLDLEFEGKSQESMAVRLPALSGDFEYKPGSADESVYAEYQIRGASGPFGDESLCSIHVEQTPTGGVTGSLKCKTPGYGTGTGTFSAEP
jgi:hypothetical protein